MNNAGVQNFSKMKYIATPAEKHFGAYHIGDTLCGGIVISLENDSLHGVIFYPTFTKENSTADDALTIEAQTILYNPLPLKGVWRLPSGYDWRTISNNSILQNYLKNTEVNYWCKNIVESVGMNLFNFKNPLHTEDAKQDEKATTLLVYQF